MSTYKDGFIKQGFNSSIRVGTDVMIWYDDASGLIPRYTRYNSADPAVIEAQLDVMQEMGIDIVRLTFQGLNAKSSPTQVTAAKLFAVETARRGMGCVLLLDPAIVSAAPTNPLETGVVSQILGPDVQEIISQSSYLLDDSKKPVIMEFDLASRAVTIGSTVFHVSISTLQTMLPQYNIGSKHKMFSWIDMPFSPATLQAFKNDNANPAMRYPGCMIEFNDAGFVNPDGTIDNTSEVWTKGAPFREAKSMAGNYYFDQLDTVPRTTPVIFIPTWNDYRERTTIEQHCAMQTGIRIGK